MASVYVGGVDDFNALVYGEKNQSTLNWMQTQFDQATNMLTEAGRSFMEGSRQLFEQFNGAEAFRRARAVVRRVQGIFQRDDIHPLLDLDKLQSALFQMQRWVMAEPTIRDLYHNQRCDGYSESYNDVEPGVKGTDHDDWRIVNNGFVLDVPAENEGEEDGWMYRVFFDEIKEGDRELTFGEKVDIHETWDMVKHYIATGEDPTSIFGNKL